MRRRTFLQMLGLGTVGFGMGRKARGKDQAADGTITLFLCGDVMTGRGIDQILPYPSRPRIYESYLKSAKDYVEIAEIKSGDIPRQAPFDYIWGDALAECDHIAPDLRIVNLETAITTSERYWPRKGINYRMHPRNTPCLSAAKLDACVLSNNHVMDWGYEGLSETLSSLDSHNIGYAGAGTDSMQAEAPLILDLPGKGRVLLYAFAHHSSGVPLVWRADRNRPGVALLKSLTGTESKRIAVDIAARKQAGDLVVVSIHWGGNWGYEIPPEQRRFAHWLVDEAGVDSVHGHSSHHPKGIELYHGVPILYGCGDFLNDYEGIGRYDAFRDDLTLAYFLTYEPSSGSLTRFVMTPMQIRKFSLHYASNQDRSWLWQTMKRECSLLETGVTRLRDGRFELELSQPSQATPAQTG
ncbi:MAG: CapA family protein [Candidatus Thiodiazotropha sp.]